MFETYAFVILCAAQTANTFQYKHKFQPICIIFIAEREEYLQYKALLRQPQFLYSKVLFFFSLFSITSSVVSADINVHFFIVCKVCISGLWTEIRAKNQ